MARIYRVLMFAPAFAPLANPEAIVNSKLALAFLDAGWHVDAITRDLAKESHYIYSAEWVEPWVALRAVTHKVVYAGREKDTQVIDTLRRAYQMGHLVDGCRWAGHAFELATSLWSKRPYDFILSRSGPDSAHLPAMRLAALTGAPWIANWNDPSGNKSPPPYGRGPQTQLGWAYERYLKAVVRSARFHTFPSEWLRRYMAGYLGPMVGNASSVIPHVAIAHTDATGYRRNDSFTITHAGHLSTERNPVLFLKAVARLKHELQVGSKLKIRIVGIVTDAMSQLARELDLEENVEFVGALPYAATLHTLATSDLNVIIEAQCVEGIFLPAKMADYVQVNRPILAIAPRNGTVADLMNAHKGGIAVDCTSGSAIFSALEQLYRHWKDGTLDNQYGTAELYNVFAQETVIGLYKELFGHIDVPRLRRSNGILDN